MAARLFWIARFIVCFINLPISSVRLHFLMTRTTFRLALAIVLSLLLHISPFIGELIQLTPPRQPARPIQAEIRVPAPLPPPPPLALKKPEPSAPAETKTSPSPIKNIKPANTWEQEIRRQFRKQQSDGQFYPAQAIAQGMEGKIWVLVILDEAGEVAAARIEQGCGHRLLDEAALRAVRALHSLPADAPRQVVVPVSYRLP
jgi:protein TonB